MSWETLAPEIHLAIFELISRDSPTGTYAAVSREWQAFFEPKHFERIILSQQRLEDFEAIVRGTKRKLVKHIWLRIELDSYDRDVCEREEHDSTIRQNSIRFSQPIKRLFTALSTWLKSEDVRKDGLLLELSVYSPGDSQYVFNHYNFEHDPYSEPCSKFMKSEINIDDPLGYWEDGNLFFEGIERTSKFAACKARVHGKGLYIWQPQHDDNPPKWLPRFLPKVDVVTGLLVRRQYLRCIHPDGLTQILRSLPRLENVVYEPPQSGGLDHERYRFVFENSLPSTLKQLTVFVDAHLERYERYVKPSSRPYTWYDLLYALMAGHLAIKSLHPPSSDKFDKDLGLSRASQTLEHLSASFLIDAEEFFQLSSPPTDVDSSVIEPFRWERLRSLALTSEILNPKGARAGIDVLIHAASVAARRMPMLRTMEIWNGRNQVKRFFDLKTYSELLGLISDRNNAVFKALSMEFGCVFRYSVDESSSERNATITWQGTWRHPMSPFVIKTWTETAQQNGYQLRVEYEDMVKDGTRFPASVLRHLKLRDQVVHPVSYRQIELLGAPRD